MKADVFGSCIKDLLKAGPGILEGLRASLVVKSCRLEHIAMNATQDLGKRNVFRCLVQEVASFLAPNTFDDLLGLEFDEDLDQVILGNLLILGQVFYSNSFPARVLLCEPKHRSGRIIAFDR